MLKKEIKEILRTYRWLLLPCVFLILGLGQPISYKLMPAILQSAKTPGMEIRMTALPTPEQVLSSVFSQYNQLGVLMIILLVMGTVAQEKANGVASGVLVKPIGKGSYLGAKFIAYSLLTVIAYLLGQLAAAYYTNILIGKFSVQAATQGSLVYMLYLLVVVALTLFTSTLFNSQVAAGGSAFIALLAITLLPRLADWLKQLFPGALAEQAAVIINTGGGEPLKPLLFSSALIILLLAGAWASLKRQEL